MRKTTTVEWMGAAFIVALAIALAIRLGWPSAHTLERALRATARWSYLWFWPSYAGSALATLFGSRFQPLAKRGRDFGLAFASAHLVHVGLVVWMLYVLSTPFPKGKLAFFGAGVFAVYLLALLSIKSVAAKVAPGTIRIIRIAGLEYIAFVFLYDFAQNPFQGGARHVMAYLPFLALAVAGPLLRVAAAAKSAGTVRAHAA